MRIMMDFKGGPLDGSMSLEREIKAGESITFEEFVVTLAGATSGYQFKLGHRFQFPSPGWMVRTVVREKGRSVMDTFEYEIVDRLEADGDLIVVAKFVGQRPDQVAAIATSG